jgi:hypothetical protein
MTKLNLSITAALLCVSLALGACSATAQTFLTIGLDAVETFTEQLVQNYAPNNPEAALISTDLTTFIGDVQSTLDAGKVTNVQLVSLIAQGTAIVKAGVPPGTPQVVAGVIQLALNALDSYLKGIQAAQPTVTAALPQFAQAFAPGGKATFKLSKKDKQALKSIKARNDALRAKLKK